SEKPPSEKSPSGDLGAQTPHREPPSRETAKPAAEADKPKTLSDLFREKTEENPRSLNDMFSNRDKERSSLVERSIEERRAEVRNTPTTPPPAEKPRVETPTPPPPPRPELQPEPESKPAAESEMPAFDPEALRAELLASVDDEAPAEDKPKTLGDQFRESSSGGGASINETVAAKAIKTENIPVHKQFQYVQKVFGGSSVKFKVVLDKINKTKSAEEAEAVLNKYVFNDPNVNPNDKIAREFQELVQGRFE
ncbi:MAG: hypothetical protein AAF570_10750, partial [Bacteroidota bacterium]